MSLGPRGVTARPSGCTVCGTGQTTTVDGVCGRRCADHPPQFDPDHAVKLAVRVGAAWAFAYCRTELPT